MRGKCASMAVFLSSLSGFTYDIAVRSGSGALNTTSKRPTRMVLQTLKIILCAALIFFCGAVPCSSARKTSPVLLVKVSFLLNFMKFTEWPASVFPPADQPLLLAVLGESPVATQIKQSLEGQLVSDRTIQVATYANLPAWRQARTMPHALFVSESISRQWTEVLALLVSHPVLTMADFPNFCAQGGMLNLVPHGDTIHFEANPGAAKKASLSLNAQMLQLAEIIPTKKEMAP